MSLSARSGKDAKPMQDALPGDRVRVPVGREFKSAKFSEGMEGAIVENRPDQRNCLVQFDDGQAPVLVGYRCLEPIPGGGSGRPGSAFRLRPLETSTAGAGQRDALLPAGPRPEAPRPRHPGIAGSSAQLGEAAHGSKLAGARRGRGGSGAGEATEVAKFDLSELRRLHDQLQRREGELLTCEEQLATAEASNSRQADELRQRREQLLLREEQIAGLKARHQAELNEARGQIYRLQEELAQLKALRGDCRSFCAARSIEDEMQVSMQLRDAVAASAAAERAAAASVDAAKDAAKAAVAARTAASCYTHMLESYQSTRSNPGISSRSEDLWSGAPDAVDCNAASAAEDFEQAAQAEGGQYSKDAVDAQDATAGGDDDARSEDSCGVQLDGDGDSSSINIDLSQPITSAHWDKIVQQLELDEDEGANIFNDLVARAGKQPSTAGDECQSFPLREFLHALHIDHNDREGLAHLAQALEAAAKTSASSGTLVRARTTMAATGDSVATATMFNKVVRALSLAKAPAEDAWRLIRQDAVPMNKVEREVLSTWQDRRQEFLQRVKHYMVEAPVVPANAGQTLCQELCTAEVEAIIERCRADGSKYTDPEWKTKESPEEVLYVDRQSPGYDCTVSKPARFQRLTTIVKNSGSTTSNALGSLFGGFSAPAKQEKKPVLFKDRPYPEDIIQGQIGTCFLLGAMGAIAGHSDSAIERLFICYDVDVGVYGIRFNIDGEWRHVIIDDIMPVDESGQLLFSRCKDPEEVWVPLIEKAYCKLHTCYEMCDGGESNEAIFSFFGGVSGQFPLKSKYRQNPDLYFEQLRGARDKGWLLTTAFKENPALRSRGSGKCGEGMLSNGLVAGHAYSVLRLVNAHGNKLICCRNPWGNGEWTGKWSDRNNEGEWTEEMKEATGYVGVEDGTFWMSIEDFVKNSEGVDFARTFGPNWKKVTHYKWFQQDKVMATAKKSYAGRAGDLSFSEGDQIEVKTFCTSYWRGTLKGDSQEGFFPPDCVEVNERPVARFELVGTKAQGVEGPMTVVVMLMQPNALMKRKYYTRREDGLRYKDTTYPRLQLCVVGPDGSIAVKREQSKRCVWAELTLPGGGLWRIYALSVDGTGSSFSMRVYCKDGTVSLRETPGGTFAELLNILDGG
eukprot:TRINITY_DN15493_c0_g4_i1.p1 TRINITY_DN15493_c0_g4~~TRINITY_DN15493_c0_g4_i1.p1  ORF type:complete len:1138 (-),score=273.81 TRINITY_DN15493_c0_g4_i1:160-3573(-)